MRKVVSFSEVAHLWANEVQTEARTSGNTFYFYGDTIYSYGRHFPIARIITNPDDGRKYCLFTNRSYSNTTAKHVTYARQANHLPAVYMAHFPEYDVNGYFNCNITSFHADNIKVWTNQIKTAYGKLARARKKEIYHNEILSNIANIRKYCEFFNLVLTESLQELFSSTTPETFAVYATNEAARIEKERKEKEARILADHLTDLARWRTFEKIGLLYSRAENIDYLRCNSQYVETSQGVKIPVSIARDFYGKILAVVNAGGCNGDCDLKILHYSVTTITDKKVVIGCHTFIMDEIQNCYNRLTEEA